MEYEELKSLWEKYDNKLDHLEKINRKLISETLIQKSQKKLNWQIFQNVYGLIAVPVVIAVVFYPLFKVENIDAKFISGAALIVLAMISSCYFFFRKYMALRKIDLQNDSVIDSASKVNRFKQFAMNSQRYVFIAYPVMAAGILLMGWNGFHFDHFTIFLMLGVVLFAISLGQKRYKTNNSKIEKLHADILEMEEYKK